MQLLRTPGDTRHVSSRIQNNNPIRSLTLLACTLLLMLSACAATSPVQSNRNTTSAPATPAATSQRESNLVLANQSYAAGDYSRAADLYLTAAQDSGQGERQTLLLRAADSGIKSQRLDVTRRAINSVQDNLLTPRQLQHANLMRAELGQLSSNPAVVLQKVPPPQAGSSHDLAQRIWAVRGRAHFLNGQVASGTQDLVRREVWLNDEQAIAANRQLLWDYLHNSPQLGNDHLYRKDLDIISRGWLELAAIERSSWADDDDYDDGIGAWRARYPNHPADPFIADLQPGSTPSGFFPQPNIASQPGGPSAASQPGFTPGAAIPPPAGVDTRPDPDPASHTSDRYTPRYNPPVQSGRLEGAIALILPLSGRRSAQAKAVRDGFMAAALDRPGAMARVMVLDSGGNSDRVLELYEKAHRDGASIVVGPLERPSVNQMARVINPQIPVLALNYLDEQNRPPQDLYQFGLSPEDEAREVARRAVNDGHLRAAIMVPQGNWGQRIADAFVQQYTYLGGQILGIENFPPDARDYSQSVKGLVARTGIADDAADTGGGYYDEEGGFYQEGGSKFLFLAARPQQARLIRPQLRYHGAKNIPVYATSHIYSGSPQTRLDADLDGVLFCDTPWVLGGNETIEHIRDTAKALYGNDFARYSRLYAFGYDAERILPLIITRRIDTGRYYTAASGHLFLGQDGRIGRRLNWARFVNGKPQALSDNLQNLQ